jgi:transposase
MRGPAERQAKTLMGVTTDDFIPADHPIRRVRRIVDELLVALSPQLTAMYARDGRHSVPPEHLIKASLPGGALLFRHGNGALVGADRVLRAAVAG